jgi:hypothetical protein
VDGLRRYRDMTKGQHVSLANEHLILTFAAIVDGERDAAHEHVGRYRDQLESVWRDHQDIPYPSVHGVYAGLFAEAYLHWLHGGRQRREDMRCFLGRLDAFRRRTDILHKADGVREITAMLGALDCPPVDPPDRRAPSIQGKLSRMMISPHELENLDLLHLCGDLDILVGRG